MFAAPEELLQNFYSNEYSESEIEEDVKTIINNDKRRSIFHSLFETTHSVFEISSAVESFNLRGYRSILMEMPLRVIVLQAQSFAQLWRRNGFSLVNQVHNYSSQLCRTEMFDRDILLLQVNNFFLILL